MEPWNRFKTIGKFVFWEIIYPRVWRGLIDFIFDRGAPYVKSKIVNWFESRNALPPDTVKSEDVENPVAELGNSKDVIVIFPSSSCTVYSTGKMFQPPNWVTCDPDYPGKETNNLLASDQNVPPQDFPQHD